MSILNDRYSKIVCINLIERPDKKKFMEDRFNKHNIQYEWYHPVILGYSRHFVNTYTERFNNPIGNKIMFNQKFPNEFGTMHSHYNVIKTALLQGVENLFVFEDDCAFHKDWDVLLPKYLNTLPENADGVLLYSYMSELNSKNVRVTPRWTVGYASWSLLAYGMNRKAMKAYINILDNSPMIADKVTWHMMTDLGFNFYVASPPLVIPSKILTSNIRGEDKNYESIKSIFTLGINESEYI